MNMDSTNMNMTAIIRRRYIPPEIVEEIFFNLPVKSLLRFSTASKSLNSMIDDERFIRKHRNRAALAGRERVLISLFIPGSLTNATTLPLSSMISHQTIDDTTPLILPSEIIPACVFLLASCGDLWCVEYGGSLFLWNPSMKTCKKLPKPLNTLGLIFHCLFEFGIGYDSVGDDYKILKLVKAFEWDELYSLRSNSWKKIPPLPKNLLRRRSSKIVCTNGLLYWVASDEASSTEAVVSFDLSSEKCVEVVQPPYDPVLRFEMGYAVEMCVIKGKLCLHVNYHYPKRYVFWGRDDSNSWIKMFDTDKCSITLSQWRSDKCEVRVLYLYDNGDILIKAQESEYSKLMFLCIDDKSTVRNVYHYNGPRNTNVDDLYVESLVSPAKYCRRPEETQSTVVVEESRKNHF